MLNNGEFYYLSWRYHNAKQAYFMRYFYYPEKSRYQTKLSSKALMFILFFCSQVVAAPQIINVPNAGVISNEIRQTTPVPLRAPQEAEIKLPPLLPPASFGGSTSAGSIMLREVRFEGDTQLLRHSNGNNKAASKESLSIRNSASISTISQPVRTACIGSTS